MKRERERESGFDKGACVSYAILPLKIIFLGVGGRGVEYAMQSFSNMGLYRDGKREKERDPDSDE